MNNGGHRQWGRGGLSISRPHIMDPVVLDSVAVAAQILSVLTSLTHPFYDVPIHGENKQTKKPRRVKRDHFNETLRNILHEALWDTSLAPKSKQTVGRPRGAVSHESTMAIVESFGCWWLHWQNWICRLELANSQLFNLQTWLSCWLPLLSAKI